MNNKTDRFIYYLHWFLVLWCFSSAGICGLHYFLIDKNVLDIISVIFNVSIFVWALNKLIRE